MLEARIQRQFFEASDLIDRCAGDVASAAAKASEAVWSCIGAGGKLMLAGHGAGAWMAPWVASMFTGRFERARPPMAALTLAGNDVNGLAGQVQALGQPGDLLLLIDPQGPSAHLVEACQRAHEAEVSALVLAGAETAGWSACLDDTDLLIAVPGERPARVAEMHLMLLHSLCDAVDLQLMGDTE